MIHVVKFTSAEDIEKYGDSYLINIQTGVNGSSVYV